MTFITCSSQSLTLITCSLLNLLLSTNYLLGQPYPFSTSAKPALPSSPPSTPLAPQLIRPKNGWHLITHLRSSYRSQLDPKSLVTTWFSRRHPDRLRPGSVLSVSSWSTPSKTGSTSFAGVLMAIRRSGPDTSFRLRNIVSRVGVEMSFKVCSPMIKEIKVIKKVERGGTLVKLASGKLGRVGKPLRRAKANFLRDKPDLLASIAGGVKEK
ncbi:translation protein SH3-like domain-containing protein [Naematelia encephala]|uniref:Translation protein SH3-like domain-containing protein n=1 Tax=Naematelia encephala TaxID=71784 RepID=A0A1Y2AY10_9TREE|nr:translation protein SH3-like domain-containing protein [Naematelia encephala]